MALSSSSHFVNACSQCRLPCFSGRHRIDLVADEGSFSDGMGGFQANPKSR